MLLIYTSKPTQRITYIFNHICKRILGLKINFTSSIEEFIAYSGPKISYGKKELGNELFFQSAELLFQEGFDSIDVVVKDWEETKCFFAVGKNSSLPFDIFSASFYLLSRYEEYLPHVKDIHGRYTAAQSMAFKYGFLEKPVVDIWAYKLLETLQQKFPNYDYKKRSYKFISTVDIDNAYAYKHKSLMRSLGGFLNDIAHFRLLNIWNRFVVVSNIKKDPFDTFQKILNSKKEKNIKTIFFFLIGDYSTFDTNVSASKTKFKLLIKEMLDYASVGLHPSYYTMNNASMLKKEKERLEGIINTPIQRSRQHYLRFSLPETYQNLIDLEVEEDYSMGYASNVGFRASTCTPFYFYDLDYEIQTPLKIFPFALMDTTLNDYMKLTPRQSLGRIRDLKNEVKAVNGTFITLFHNESLSDYLRWKGWKKLYDSMIKIATS